MQIVIGESIDVTSPIVLFYKAPNKNCSLSVKNSLGQVHETLGSGDSVVLDIEDTYTTKEFENTISCECSGELHQFSLAVINDFSHCEVDYFTDEGLTQTCGIVPQVNENYILYINSSVNPIQIELRRANPTDNSITTVIGTELPWNEPVSGQNVPYDGLFRDYSDGTVKWFRPSFVDDPSSNLGATILYEYNPDTDTFSDLGPVDWQPQGDGWVVHMVDAALGVPSTPGNPNCRVFLGHVLSHDPNSPPATRVEEGVWEVDLETGEMTLVLPPTHPDMVSLGLTGFSDMNLLPDGNIIMIVGGAQETVYITDPAFSSVSLLFTSNGPTSNSGIIVDGNTIKFYNNNADGEEWLYDPNSQSASFVGNFTYADEGLAYDGTHIALEPFEVGGGQTNVLRISCYSCDGDSCEEWFSVDTGDVHVPVNPVPLSPFGDVERDIIGCVYDQDGTTILGQVYLSTRYDENGVVISDEKVYVPYDGSPIIRPYTGTFSECSQEDIELVSKQDCFVAVNDSPVDYPSSGDAIGTAYQVGDQISYYAVYAEEDMSSPMTILYQNLTNGSFPSAFYYHNNGIDVIGTEPNSSDFSPCVEPLLTSINSNVESIITSLSTKLTEPISACLNVLETEQTGWGYFRDVMDVATGQVVNRFYYEGNLQKIDDAYTVAISQECPCDGTSLELDPLLEDYQIVEITNTEAGTETNYTTTDNSALTPIWVDDEGNQTTSNLFAKTWPDATPRTIRLYYPKDATGGNFVVTGQSVTKIEVLSPPVGISSLQNPANQITDGNVNYSDFPGALGLIIGTNPQTQLDISQNTVCVTLHAFSMDLTNITWPPTGAFASVLLRNNNLTSAEVDEAIIALDSYGVSNGTLQIDLQSPAAPPTGTSAAALANLISNGWTVTTD